MKINTKNKIIFNVFKNQNLFDQIFWTKEKPIEFLAYLFETYNNKNPGGLNIEIPLHNKNEQEIIKSFQSYNKNFTESLQTIKKWDSKRISSFLNDIDKLLDISNLGKEWKLPMITIIVRNWFFPPIYNFYIIKKPNAKRVLIELNPDTSLDDIKMGWNKITQNKKALWPNFQSVNLTKKSWLHLSIAIQDKINRSSPKKKIDEYSRLVETSKDTDLDRVVELWPDEEDISKETDRKRVQNLRQIRHRFHKKA